MLQRITNWNSWLGSHMFLVTFLALISGCFFKFTNSPELRLTLIGLFAYMTFITSLTISTKSFFTILQRPWLSLWSLALIHAGSPLIAWLLGWLFYADAPNIRLAYLILATLPVGVTSVIWVALTKGNVALALVTVTLDTLIAPLILPLYFKLVIAQAIELDYTKMMLDMLAMITAPSLLGMIIHDLLPQRSVDFAKGIGGLTSKIGFFTVIFINVTLVAPLISWNTAIIKIMLVTLLVVAAAYALGYMASLVVPGQPRDIKLSMIYTVGLRNLSFGLVLALTYFPVETAIPITMGILYQQPFAALIPYLLRRRTPTMATDN